MRDMSHREPQRAPLGRWRRAAPCRGRDTSGWPLLRSAPLSGLLCRLSSRQNMAGFLRAPKRKANVPRGGSFLPSPLQGALQRPEGLKRSEKMHGSSRQFLSP